MKDKSKLTFLSKDDVKNTLKVLWERDNQKCYKCNEHAYFLNRLDMPSCSTHVDDPIKIESSPIRDNHFMEGIKRSEK
ncbi:MAG: hypothetical protein WC679_13265 [Bacteroidales bacterium]|jgi:hypothetical protein